jgi:GTP-binding protein
MADIPGLIEGAHAGRGLGHRFLRHIERNSILLFVVAADADSIAEQYRILVHELEAYNPELLSKRRFLAISKADLADNELRQGLSHELPDGVPSMFISSVTGEGIPELKDEIWKLLQ